MQRNLQQNNWHTNPPNMLLLSLFTSRQLSVVNFVKNQKGGLNSQDSRGFQYRINRSCPAKDCTYWTCINRLKDSCPALVIIVTSSKEIIQEADNHTHSNHLVEKKVRKVKEENIKATALTPTVMPRSVLGTITVNLETNMPGTVSFISHRQQENPKPQEFPEGV